MWQPSEISAEAFGSDFTLLMDNRVPSCRSLNKALAGADLTSFQFYLIDGMIVSANVQPETVETLDYGFICTDHNPVRLRFTLQP